MRAAIRLPTAALLPLKSLSGAKMRRGPLLCGTGQTYHCLSYPAILRDSRVYPYHVGAYRPLHFPFNQSKGVTMKQSLLDLSLAIVLGFAFSLLALAYFDCLYL